MVRRLLSELQQRRALPDPDYVLNHVVNRVPLVDARMRAYAALGVDFDDAGSANIALGVEVWGGHGLSIGSRSTIGQRCYIDARAGIRIDADVSVSREVCILTATHDIDSPDFGSALDPVHLGANCFIGVRALILPGVRVGPGAVVGAGALVSSDVKAYSVVAGVPAKELRTRPGPMSYALDWRPNWY
jgi:acetyltransferase-like isoleucine patch superfamily enzyme